MKIETKYSIKDVLYFMYSNRIQSGRPNKINIVLQECTNSVTRKRDYTTYIEYIFNSNTMRRESEVFATKEELIESLYRS